MSKRGAQLNTHIRFLKNSLVFEHLEGLDERAEQASQTVFFIEHPKKVINKVESPDIGPTYSLNPYQGCEHGCIYCYARNSHEYWGFSAGIDFEQKIIVKENAAEVLEKEFDKKNYHPAPIMLSGNTDCYQPGERKFGITRKILEICLRYRNPIGIITKNSLIIRDIDILKELSQHRLVHVNFSITSLDEALRLKLEPRTASAAKRLNAVRKLSESGIPVRVMAAPIIPGLNNSEIPEILKRASENGALGAAYTLVRLNGAIGEIFSDWAKAKLPDKADKILNQIKSCHSGQLNDSRFETRMRGEGKIAESIAQLFKLSQKKYFANKQMPPFDTKAFKRPDKGQLSLF